MSVLWHCRQCGDVGGPATCYIYDATQKAAREFYWDGLRSGYYKYGIKVFWLDASEPEISTHDAQLAANEFNNSLGPPAAQSRLLTDMPALLPRSLGLVCVRWKADVN